MRFASAATVVGVFLAAAVAFSQLTQAQRRGREIYTRGASASGAGITAVLGDGSTEVGAEIARCSGCHNYDGRGKPEGGATPSNITWDMLTRPYPVTEAGGRIHGPYTERFLQRAITMGIDPAGNRLSAVMPRFRFSREDIANLVAYIKILGTLPAPGLAEDATRIGILLPAQAQSEEAGDAVESVLRAYFDQVNRRGGVYGRRLELIAGRLPADPARSAAVASDFLRKERPFALLSPFLAGIEDRLAPLFQQEGIPVIGPFVLVPQLSAPVNPYVFYLDGGPIGELEALQEFADARLSGRTRPRALVFSSDLAGVALDARFHQRADLLVEEIGGSGAPAEALAARVVQAGAEAVFVAARGAATVEVLRSFARMAKPPLCLIPGSLVTPEIFDLPVSLDGMLVAAYSILPSDSTPEGRAEYQSLAGNSNLPAGYRPSQFRALAAAHVLTEALRRSGRELSRDKLAETLEHLYEFNTGFAPAVSFGPARRIGVPGIHLVHIDLRRKDLAPIPANGGSQ